MLKTKIATDKIVNLYDEGRFKNNEGVLLISVLFTIIRLAMFQKVKIFSPSTIIANDNCEKNMDVIKATFSIMKGNIIPDLIQRLEQVGVDIIVLKQAWQRGWEQIAEVELKTLLLLPPPVDRRINMYEVTYILNCLRRAGVKLTNVNFPLKELRRYNGKI